MQQVTKPASKEQWEEFLGVTDLTPKQVFLLNYDHLVSQGRVDEKLNQIEPLHLMLRSSTNPELPPTYTGYTLAPSNPQSATLEVGAVGVPKKRHYGPKEQGTLTARVNKTKTDTEKDRSGGKRQESSTTKEYKTEKYADNVQDDNK
ncbi:MAG: hypothetical protein M1831_007196 [Alyxoria varia]|nr:MAG: hypothetical protein M1831_007196 [Alyxoria varia]